MTTGAITANGSAGSGANQAGGNGGVISVTSNGTLVTGVLAASGGNGGLATVASGGGDAGSIAVTNNSTTAGTLTTGTLTARAGVAPVPSSAAQQAASMSPTRQRPCCRPGPSTPVARPAVPAAMSP